MCSAKVTRAEVAIPRILLDVRLGVSLEERQKPQPVAFGVRLFYPPTSLQGQLQRSDSIDRVVCYDELVRELKAKLATREFQLVESLGFFAFSVCRNFIPDTTRLELRATKLRPPVAEIDGGVFFELSDVE